MPHRHNGGFLKCPVVAIEPPQQLLPHVVQPIQPRHLQIEQHKIRVEDGQARQRIDAIDGTVDLVPFRFDPVGQGLADILVIIDDEDSPKLTRAMVSSAMLAFR